MYSIRDFPLCGGKAEIHGTVHFKVVCNVCGARTATYRFREADDYTEQNTKERAIAAWNRRKEF